MRIKSFFINDRQYAKKWIYIIFTLFIIGVCSGTVYSITLTQDADNSVNRYLVSYFEQLNSVTNHFEILKNSIYDYMKLFTLIFLCSFIRPGIVLIGSSVILKGFITGFTAASFIKYYGTGGLLAQAAALPSTLIFVPALTLFAASAAIFCINRHRSDKSKFRTFMTLSICCLTIFCAVSFLDAFVTTTFMKFFSSFFAVG